MGGRGAYSTSGKPMAMGRRHAINSQLEGLDAEIARIDAGLAASVEKDIEDSRASRFNSWITNMSEQELAEYRNELTAYYASETSRADLARQRSKLRAELEAIRKGQGTLF